MKIAHIVHRGRLEIGHAADGRMLVRMLAERLVVDNLVQPAERLIVHPQPAFFLDHVAFVGEGLAVDPQRRHPIGFEPQGERQIVGRQRGPEHRLVIGRIGVALAAAAGNHRRVPLGRDVLRALEHQVLEQVRKPGPARLLVLRPDVIPQLHVHDRRRMVFRQHDRQPVGQRRELILKLGRRNGGRRRQAGEGNNARCQQDCGARTQ